MDHLLSYLTDTATLFHRTGVNAFGEDVYDTGHDIPCRVRVRHLAAPTPAGEAQRCVGEVWLLAGQTCAPGDQLLYDGDYLTLRQLERVCDLAGETVGLRGRVE